MYFNVHKYYDRNHIHFVHTIVNFVIYSEISYSKNKNGMHFNISVLSDENITGIYDIIYYEMNEKIDDNKYWKLNYRFKYKY